MNIFHRTQVSYAITDPNTSKIDKTACSLGLTGSNGWCASTFNPNSNDPFLGSITANKALTTTKSETTSIYMLDNIEINPQWLLDLGVRWDKFDSNIFYNKSTTGRTPVEAGTRFENNSDFWSWNTGLTFKPTENGSIYFSYATSANPVGVDQGDGSDSLGTTTQVNDLKPEKARTLEIGTKWNLLNNKLNTTAAIFRTEKQNTRIAIDANTSANVGESTVDGLEIGVNGNITDKWAISAGYTYLDSKLVKAAYNAENTEDNQLPNVPKNSATLWTTYQVLPQLNLGVGAIAMDKVYGNATNTKFVPGYVRYDAMARYNVNKNVDLQLNVNNLSDARYFTKAYASHYATEAEGRSAVLSVNFKY